MASLILPRRFTQQPQYPVEVVSDLQDGLLCAYMPHVGDPANRNIPLTTPTAISDQGDLSCYRTGAAGDIARYVNDPVNFTLTWLQYDTAAIGYGYFIKIWRFSDFESIKVYRNWTYNRSVLEFRVQPSSTKSFVPSTDWITLGKRSVETIVRTGDTVKWFSNRKLVGSTTGIGTTALGIYGTPYLQLGQTGGHNVGAVLFHGKALPEAQIAELHSNYYGRAFRRRPQVLYFDTAAGGATYTISPTGSIAFSNTSKLVFGKQISPTGSIVFSNTVSFVKEKVIYPTGSIVYSGTAPLSTEVSYTISPTGSIVFNGTVLPIHEKIVVPIGTLVFSGSANISAEASYTISPTGDITFSGTNNFLYGKTLIPTGTVVFSGTASITSNTSAPQTITTRLPLTGIGT